MAGISFYTVLPLDSHRHPALDSKERLYVTEEAEKTGQAEKTRQAGSRIDDPSFSCIIAFFHSLPHGCKEQEVGWGLLLSPLAL
jgi:hypothetical protein